MTVRFDYLESQLNIGWQADTSVVGFGSPLDQASTSVPLFAKANRNLPGSLITRDSLSSKPCVSLLPHVGQLSYREMIEDLDAISCVDDTIDRSGEQLVGDHLPAPIVSAFVRQAVSASRHFRKVKSSKALH